MARAANHTAEFDAIVVGSGITGGWAAKELTEQGLKVLMIERGPMIEHQNYAHETTAPWELPFGGYGDPDLIARDYTIQSKGRGFSEWTLQHFVNDRENPYETGGEQPFQWRRGYQLGGRSLIWGRQCYRWSDLDFEANGKDGYGTDWPIRYKDLAPWYDKVEEFIGVQGSIEGLPQLPDGHFLPPMAMNAVEIHAKSKIEQAFPDRKFIMGRAANLTEEKEGRSACQYRGICSRGCSYGAYFSTQSSTLPAARATGRLTILGDSVVDKLDYDAQTRRVTGVEVISTKDRERSRHTARIVFLCASSFNSVAVLLRSASEAHPHGLANSSGALGHYIMDHAGSVTAIGLIPGFEEHAYFGNRPNNIVIPRFKNLDGKQEAFVRGYSFQGGASRTGWTRGAKQAGIGASLKEDLRGPGPWQLFLGAFAECLPRRENRVTLSKSAVDSLGMAQLRIDFAYGENEKLAMKDAAGEAKAMLELLGARVVRLTDEPDAGGSSVHEMGGARMGRDPSSSVLNGRNQAHDVANLFITDGSAMASSACQNPSLTYMALTARACHTAASMLKEGTI